MSGRKSCAWHLLSHCDLFPCSQLVITASKDKREQEDLDPRVGYHCSSDDICYVKKEKITSGPPAALEAFNTSMLPQVVQQF